ncbi:helix-turn-helix domain-containing protein [Pseudonocardia sp. MH-G8]|uniref:winged helix-turn-helix domain-containing protein n=1 Tax=Pseudonocardia sp. MH-G8 TaxID=1854588 RepID=UPI000BA0A259|nr:helix-turn-helix domain-containing protein [Pseudonocardia sp. MH-G8]OZM81981.1 transcriptional regulator [Pseudonocardia sp. MH-G8]
MTEHRPERITDPKALRALSHPTRWKLIELLGLERTATATRCADFTGESVASCSYHLNMLAKYGFVEQAGGGTGREKPWKLVKYDQSWETEGLEPEGQLAAEALTDVFLDYENSRMKDAARRQEREPQEWRRNSRKRASLTYLTVDELEQVSQELRAILDRYGNRLEDPARRPAGSRAVRMFFATYFPPGSGE